MSAGCSSVMDRGERPDDIGWPTERMKHYEGLCLSRRNAPAVNVDDGLGEVEEGVVDSGEFVEGINSGAIVEGIKVISVPA